MQAIDFDSSRVRMRMKGGSVEGEIVQVQGGHIIRSTGRKDRHSKVYTSRGPRDRRVRLSAHTAIEFYDVQDRLGYDRPSKAVDWLIEKAKSAIDNLAELPPWHPNMNNNAAADMDGGSADQMDTFHNQIHTQVGDHNTNDGSSFMSPPTAALDTTNNAAAIADSIKSFFPTNNAAAMGEASSIHFQNYPADIITRSCTNPSEDLGLSLHTAFQDPLHHPTADHPHHQSNNTLFNAGSANNNNPNVGFDSNFQRMLAWNIHETSTETRVAAAGGFLFNNSPPLSSPQAAALAFAQRGPLQSSFTQSVRAWDDIPVGKTQEIIHHSNSIFGLPGASAGFTIPAYHHHQQQHHHSDRPYSSSPNNSHR